VRALWLSIVLGLITPSAGAEPEKGALPAPGVFAERDAGRPGQSYVLVLPPGYSPQKLWPILYLLDTNGRGRRAAERFAAGAARFGYVVASSNNSRANVPGDPNLPALSAMWDDTHARLALDPRRAYLSGFSGTARFSTIAARRVGGHIAGVIGCGAGFSSGEPPAPGLPFVYYGLVGDRDFNYTEMMELRETLRGLNAAHAISVFPGGHEWPPPEATERALAWMELRALKGGLRPADPALLETLLTERRTEARAQDVAGNELTALEAWRAIAADFAGLADVTAETERARVLEASPAWKRAREQEQRRARAEAAELSRARSVVTSALVDDETGPRMPARIARELALDGLRKRAAGGDLGAARVLAEITAQTGFFLPREARDRGDMETAVLLLGVATLAAPERPQLWLALAGAEARRGSRAKAKEALTRAIAAGLTGRENVTRDPDLAPLLKLPDFQALVNGMAN
jgi:predicted esterase